jgi:hypothetical protein
MVILLMNAYTACMEIAGTAPIVDLLLSEVLAGIGSSTNEIDA